MAYESCTPISRIASVISKHSKLKHPPTYGCLFIPILKKKLPDELLVIISRKFAGNVCVFDELLKHF